MKITNAITASLLMLLSNGVYGDEFSSTLSDDATRLTAEETQWSSDILDLKLRDGSITKMRLELEFTPIKQGGAIDSRHAKVIQKVSTPTAGLPGAFRVTTSVGSSPKDIQLQQKGDIRTMIVTRSMDEFPELDVNSTQYQRTQRNFVNTATVFTYDLKGDTLILKGFPTSAIVWGSSEFIAPQNDIVFKARRVE